MKKKNKLFASIAAIALCVCALSFGVYAAISATFYATGTISFNAYDCLATITGTITGAVQKPNGTVIKTSYLGNNNNQNFNFANWTFGDLAFDELGTPSAIPEPITISMNITNNSEFPISATIEGIKANTSSALDIKITNASEIAKNGTATITIVISIKTGAENSAVISADMAFNVSLVKVGT